MDTCYHIWALAKTGTSLFRYAHCYPSRSAANNAIARWRQNPPVRERKDAFGNTIYDTRTGQPVFTRPTVSPVMMTLKCHAWQYDSHGSPQHICPCACARNAAEAARAAELDDNAADLDTPDRQAV